MNKNKIISILTGAVLLLGTFLPVVKAETEQNLQNNDSEQAIKDLDETETNNEELEASSPEDEETEIDEVSRKETEKDSIPSEVIESNSDTNISEQTEKNESEVKNNNKEDEMPVIINEESEAYVELINKLLATKELEEFDLILEKYSEDELEKFVLSLSDKNYKKIEKHFEYLLDKERTETEELQQKEEENKTVNFDNVAPLKNSAASEN